MNHTHLHYWFQQAMHEAIPQCHDDRPYGYPIRDMMVHKHPHTDNFIISYDGRKLAEYTDQKRFFIYVPEKSDKESAWRWHATLTNRLHMMFGSTWFASRTTQKANGEYSTMLYIGNQTHITGKTRARAIHRWEVIEEDGKLGIVNADPEPTTKRVKDNFKYRLFNKQLKELWAVLHTQRKMNAVPQFMNGAYSIYKMRNEIEQHPLNKIVLDKMTVTDERFRHPRIPKLEESPILDIALEWFSTRNPDLIPYVWFAVKAYSGTTSGASEKELVELELNSFYKKFQQFYLRKECIRIVSTDPQASNETNEYHQTCELFPPTGLREVQISSEAEVRRQNTGT